MATFTFRVPDSMTGRLSSAEMRSWLTQFVRNPYSLPPDPGSGYERVSLTLPRELVAQVAGYLRCSPSTALRRLAQAYLGPSRPSPITAPPVPRPGLFPTVSSSPRAATPAPRYSLVPGCRSVSQQDKVAAAIGQLIAGALSMAIIFLILYLSGKLKSTPKPA
jgi:hypothetical protein